MPELRNPEPLWFGQARARVFGMLHRPDAPSDRGVVLCNTLGFDGMIAHRAFRHLADEIATRGSWALRIDYDGEGDSAGGPWEPDRLAAWIASIDAAVGVLRNRGVTDVRLVGFRAGASLAYLASTLRPGISGIALWSPFVNGATFTRELKALSRLSTAARPSQQIAADRFPADSLEVGGFEFSGEALADLARVDLDAAPLPSGNPAMLVIDRVDAPACDALVAKLAGAGLNVEHESMPGHAEFMTNDELRSVLPWPIINRILDWLDARPAGAGMHTPHRNGTVEAVVSESHVLDVDEPAAGRYPPPGVAHDAVYEEAAWIGERMFAIVSRPAGREPSRRAAIVLCNPGWTKRTGPGRLYVDLARYWASLGFTVVRLELGGAGDSMGVADAAQNQPHAPMRIDEVREAAAWVRNLTGFDSLVMLGLCSGAFNVFHAALEGLDLDHAILVNPSMFYLGADQTVSASDEARLWAAHALRQGMMNPRKWLIAAREPQFLKRGLRRACELLRSGATDGIRLAAKGMARNAAGRVGLHVKPPSALPADLDRITERGVKVFMIFAAGEGAAQYLRVFAGPAFEESLKATGQLVEVNGGDHSFSTPGSRQRLFEEATAYLEHAYRPAWGLTTATAPDREQMGA